ncbi:MAG: Rdx family protein [Proteobacteria bacterium]|nr:Rdx family protein [Pseudomonadota bacterium]
MPQATSLAAAIMEKTGSEPELVRGDKGIFDVTVDGRLIFSKHETGRFPEHKEVLEQL